MASDPKNVYFNQQNIVNIDVEAYYKKLQQIDKYRSRFNASDVNFNTIKTITDLDSIQSQASSISIFPQESRCNTFFRMLGLPVTSCEEDQIYSPGYDPESNMKSTRLQKKLTTAIATWNKLKKSFLQRERYPHEMLFLFEQQDFESSASAISSIYPRPFEKQLKPNLDPDKFDSQQFTISDRHYVAADFDEQDQLSHISQSTHIIKPFIVDPRVELTVNPGLNLICVPFLANKGKTQLFAHNYLSRPYIERVMRVRFNEQNIITSTLEDVPDSIIDEYIIRGKISNPLQDLHKSEINRFNKFIEIIYDLLVTLHNHSVSINRIRADINWKPIPHKNGPEFGCTTNKVRVDVNNNKSIEERILEAETKKFIHSIELDIGAIAPDLGDFVFSDIDDMISDETKDNTEFQDKQLNQLNNDREDQANNANHALREIEIITGEFSGLGLLDMFAIQAAFWALEPEALLGLIDDEAIVRMQKFPNLKANVGSRLKPKDALQKLETKISSIYTLMDVFYKDIINYDGKKRN